MTEIFLLLLRQDPKKEKEHMEFESIHSMITGTLFDFNSTNWNFWMRIICEKNLTPS